MKINTQGSTESISVIPGFASLRIQAFGYLFPQQILLSYHGLGEAASMLLRTYLLGKIHNIRLTDKNVNYVGSITLGPEFLQASGIQVHEAVHVVNVENGARLMTYVLPGGKPGECTLNGGAARLAEVGDKLIVMAFAQSEKPILPKTAMIDEQNRIQRISAHEGTEGGG